MNKMIKTIGLATALTLISSTAMAGNKYHHTDEYNHHDDRRYSYQQDRARVIDVEPIYRYVHVRNPDRECYREPARDRNSYTSTIAGGIVGGIIGNQFGGGSGKTVMTVAGTLLGGSIGRDLNREYYQDTRYERRCHVSSQHHKERIIDGYHVTYRYQGKHYTTRTEHHPGKFIPVDVHVKPSEQVYNTRRYY